jgi:amidase
VNGVLTRSVADTALFLDVASGAVDIDEDKPPPPAVPFSQAAATAPGTLRIAYSTRIPPGVISRLDTDAARALHETVELLRSLGHQVSERDPDYGAGGLPSAVARYMRGIHDDASALAHPERLERRTRAMARLGGLIPRAQLDRVLAGEAQLTARLGSVFDDHDVLMTPATATPPPRIGQLEGRGALWTLNAIAGMVPYNAVWNATGQPAASVPAGFGADGLPRAVQLVGRANDEPTLLSLAAQIEAERPWAQQRPPHFS